MGKIPYTTQEFIMQLKEEYEDEYQIDEKFVGTPSYWKKAGVIEIIKRFENYIKEKELDYVYE